MGGMNILFPFTVCQDLVNNQDDQQCHVYKASVSVGETDGTKTNGSLRARVVSTNSPQADKMVEIDFLFPCLLAKYLTERERLHFRIEGLQKKLQNEESTINCSEDLEQPHRDEADDSHIPKQTEQAVDHKSLGKESTNGPSLNGEKPLLSMKVDNFHKSSDEVQKEENQNTAVSAESEADQVSLAANVSNSDHGYSLTVCESQHRDQITTTFNLPKQTMKNPKRSTNKYDELIRKLKQPIDAPKVAGSLLAHSSLSTQNVPPTNTTSACGLSADMHRSLSGTRSEKPQAQNVDGTDQKGGMGDNTKNQDCTTDEAVPLGSSASVQRRFVRKYDRLIKSLEMASERSGLEMLSVLSGHSYKLDHDAKREQNRPDSVTVDMSVKGGTTCDGGAKLAARGDDSGSSLEPVKDKNISGKMKGSVSSSGKPSQQNLSHMTSFPRKFPSSLTRTDVLNVFVSNTKAGQNRKRRLASTGMIEGTSLSKHKKTDDEGKLGTSSADSEIERTHAESSKDLPKNGSTVSGEKGKTSILPEAAGATVTASTCVNSLLSSPASTAPAARDLKAQSQSPRGLSELFYLPLGPSGNGQSISKAQENVLVGPFQLLGDVAPKTCVPMAVSNDTKPFSGMPGHLMSSGSLSSSRGRKALKGEPPRTDHDYTNLVYDKNAPSSRALKTLVKPISMSQHINARVERVEEGEGSCLVTISGLNRKAAGGSHPYTLRPVLGVSKDGMCIAETLEDAFADTIRCREKLQESYRTALEAKSCQPVQVDASDVPVAREVVITPARCHPDILHHSFKPCTFTPRTKRKPPTLQHHAKTEDSDAQGAILFVQGEAENGKKTVTNPLFYSNEVKAERVEETDSLFQEQSNPVLMGTRLQTGEQILVINSSHSEPDLDSIIHTHNETVKQDTSTHCNEEMTIKHTFTNDGKKPPEQHVVIDNEKETTASQHLSVNVCRYCLKIFHSPTMLYKHVITVHTAYSVSPQATHYLQTLKMDSQVVCPLCPNLYILCNEYHLRAHLVSCHGRTKADLADSSAGAPASVVCEVCQMHFLMVKELETHARLMHSCDVVSCPHCPLVFVVEDTRAKHMAMVHGDNSGCPFVCRLCGAAFESKDDLRLHKQVHGRRSRPQDSVKTRITTPPRRAKWRTRGPRRCQHCPSLEFPDLAHLFRHNQQVHAGPVPVHCLFCGQGFRNTRAMSLHLRTHLSPPCTSRGRPTSLHCPFCDQKAFLSIPCQLVSHMLKRHPDRFPYSCRLCSQSFASEKPLHIHLKQAHRREVAGVSGAPSALDPVTGGNSDSDRIRESCPESSMSVASTSQGAAGKADAVSVLRCLPEEAQTLIQKITQQGKQAVVTISLQKRGEQKIVFTPSPSHSTSQVLKPASQPTSVLTSAKRLPRTEHLQSVRDIHTGKDVSDELSSSEDPLAGLYISSLGGAATGVEEGTSTDTYVVIHNSSMDTGFTDTNYEYLQDADQTDAKSITMINSGDISAVSSGTPNAVDGCGEYFSEQASHVEEDTMGEMPVLVAEEVFVIGNVE